MYIRDMRGSCVSLFLNLFVDFPLDRFVNGLVESSVERLYECMCSVPLVARWRLHWSLEPDPVADLQWQLNVTRFGELCLKDVFFIFYLVLECIGKVYSNVVILHHKIIMIKS